MNVGVDCRWITGRISGIGRYTRELVRALAALETPHRFTLYCNGAGTASDLEDLARRHRRVRVILLSGSPFSPWGQVSLPLRLRRDGVDLFFSTNFMIPLLPGGVPAVCTVHDLIPLLYPHYVSRSIKTRLHGVYALLMRLIARRAARIIAVSAHTKADLEGALALPPERIAVIHNGAPRGPLAPFDGPLPWAEQMEGREIILTVGRWDPYKNLCGLLRAFAPLSRRRPSALLVIAGEVDTRYPEPLALIASLGLSDRVLVTGYVDEAVLESLYRAARLLALPSLYEGFGLGLLEAWAHDLPAAASNAASIPEVAGTAALLFDPLNPDDMAARIEQGLEDGAERRRLVEAGRERLSLFSWERAARQTLEVFEQVCPGR